MYVTGRRTLVMYKDLLTLRFYFACCASRCDTRAVLVAICRDPGRLGVASDYELAYRWTVVKWEQRFSVALPAVAYSMDDSQS